MSQYCGEDLSIKYERNNNISYAVVDITDSNELVEYEMKMLMRNRPDYFLQFSNGNELLWNSFESYSTYYFKIFYF